MSFGSAGSDTLGGLAVDQTGNVFITGSFAEDITLGTNTFRNQGKEDIFLMKTTPEGAVAWATALGGEFPDTSRGLALDSQGGLLLAGMFGSVVNVHGEWLVSRGGQDLLLLKFETNGQPVWHRHAGGTGSDEVKGMAVDRQDNLLVAGVFDSGTIQFGDAALTNRGQGDVFLAKYDPQGNLLWLQQGGGAGDDFASAVAVDPAGNVYLTGSCQTPARFGTNDLNAGSEPVFLAKYNPAGQLQWARTVGSGSETYARGLAVNGAGEIYQSGYFSGTTAFDTTSLESAGLFDIFLAKYDAQGKVLWGRRAGGSSLDQGSSLILEGNGHALMTGYFFGSANFDAQTATCMGQSFFLARYTPQGEVAWVQAPQTSLGSEGKAIAVGPNGQVFVAGEFSSSLIVTNTALTNRGMRDVFVARAQAGSCSGPGLLYPLALKKLDTRTFEITADVSPGQPHEIQSSEDLLLWTSRTNFTAQTDRMTWTDNIPSGVTRRFYRNRQLCP